MWNYLSTSFDETKTNKHWDAGSASEVSHFKNKFRFRQQQWCLYVRWVCGDKCSKNRKNVLSRSRVFNRHLINGVYFDSPGYKRSKIGNCFVSFVRANVEFYGQIMYFIKISGPPYIVEVQANVNLFEIVEEIGPVKGFFFRVRSTDHEKIVALPLLKKIFLFTDFPKNKDLSQTEKFIVKLCSSFEHS